MNRGRWNAGTNYNVGDYVTYGTGTYYCNVAGVSPIPPSANPNWVPGAPGGGGGGTGGHGGSPPDSDHDGLVGDAETNSRALGVDHATDVATQLLIDENTALALLVGEGAGSLYVERDLVYAEIFGPGGDGTGLKQAPGQPGYMGEDYNQALTDLWGWLDGPPVSHSVQAVPVPVTLPAIPSDIREQLIAVAWQHKKQRRNAFGNLL